MEQIGKFRLFSSEEVLDKHFGKVGTPRRDEFERSVAESVHAYELGEAIKKHDFNKILRRNNWVSALVYREHRFPD